MRRVLMPLFALVLITGCRGSKIHQETSFDVAPGDIHEVMVDPPKKQQSVRVIVTSDVAVTVYIVLEKDIPDKNSEKYDATKNKPLASETKTTQATLIATIPAGEPYWILVTGAEKKAKVNLKIDSQ